MCYKVDKYKCAFGDVCVQALRQTTIRLIIMKNYKIILFTTIILFNITSIYSQTECNCNAFIDPNYDKQVYIFDKPNGLIIDSIKNDIKNEDYLVINIQKNVNNYYFVEISRSLSKLSKVGWIRQSDYLVINASNFINSKTLILYSSPDINSEPLMTLDEYAYLLFKIEVCNGDWLYVRKEYKGIEYIGWLSKKNQCANPYSTCN